MEITSSKAFLINENGSHPVEIPYVNRLDTLYNLIGCELVQALEWKLTTGENVTLYLDEEALLTSGFKLASFLHGAATPLLGKIVVLGLVDHTAEEPRELSAPDGFKEEHLISHKAIVSVQA